MTKEWTVARKKSFVISALRGARWPAKYGCVNAAYVRDGINPKTGRKCKLHRCSKCKELFPKGKIQADHIDPVVGPEGFISWDVYIERIFCGEEGFQALCHECHATKTLMERLKIGEKDVPKYRRLIAFKKMKATAQIKMLKRFKIEPGANGEQRVEAFKKKLEI